MNIDIPIREVKMYQSDDGKRIEEHKTVKFINIEVDDSESESLSDVELVYFGTASISSPMGPQEIKFPIEAETLEDAFYEFMPSIEKIMEDMQTQIIDPTDGELILLTLKKNIYPKDFVNYLDMNIL